MDSAAKNVAVFENPESRSGEGWKREKRAVLFHTDRSDGSEAHPDEVARGGNQVSRFYGNCSGQLVDMEVQPYVAGAGSHTSREPLLAAWLTAAFSNRNRSIRPDRPLGSALMPLFSPAMALGGVNRHRFPLAGDSFSVQAVDTCSATYAL